MSLGLSVKFLKISNPPRRYGWVFLLCLGLSNISAAPHISDEEKIKISYLYNFAKFIKWPADFHPEKTGTHFSICTVGTSPISLSLPALENRLINGRPIEIQDAFTLLGEGNVCEMVYIGISEQNHYPLVLAQIARSPTLTVSDIPGFIHKGGMIGLMVRGHRVRFVINLKAIQAAGLSANSQLLNLAVEVIR